MKNPKKAGILALLLGVALWFWAPLIRGWMGGDETSGPETATVTKETEATPTTATTTTPAPAAEPAEVQYGWQQWLEWIEQDERTKPDTFAVDRRDPFQWSEQKRKARQQQLQEEEEKESRQTGQQTAKAETPETLGMAVTSIIAGRRRRFARIDGTVYELGELVTAHRASGGASPADGTEADGFRLVEIHDTYVVLERDAAQYRLGMKQQGLARGDSIGRVAPGNNGN